MKKILLILTVLLLFSACTSRKAKEQTINMSGAFALYPLVVKWAEEYKKEHPEIRFNISAGGAGKGMADALSGTVDLGMFSRAISDEEKQKGVWWAGLAIDAVLPTISAENPYLSLLKKKGFTRDKFAAVFIGGNLSDWGLALDTFPGSKIAVYTRSDACGAAETWAAFLDARQENLKGIGIYGDPGLAEAVAKDPEGIAFNNTAYIFDFRTGKKRAGLEVLPLDLNKNGKIDPDEDFYDSLETLLDAVAGNIYPSPPARELYFVSKGKPEKKAVIDFIRWVLTDGQQYVKEAGYVPVNNQKIELYLEKLE